MLRGLLFSLLLISFFTPAKGVVIIAQQDFEKTPATPTWAYTTSNIGTPGAATDTVSGNTPAMNASPANSPYYTSGTTGYRIQSNSSGTTSGRIFNFSAINTSTYSNISVSFRVAGMSIGTASNGIDNNPNADLVKIEVSTDGSTWYEQARVVTNGSNTRWAFSATGSGTRDYIANNSFTNFTCNGSNVVTGNNGITKATITKLPSVTTLYVRITAQTNATTTNESWIIDDVILFSEEDVPTLIAGPDVTGLDYDLGNGPSAPKTFSVKGNFLEPASDTVKLVAPANFQLALSSSGPYSDTIKLVYTDSTLDSTGIYVRLKTGLPVNTYSGNVVVSGGNADDVTVAVSGAVTSDVCVDLFISEYIEGSGNNKCIEIYNPTGSTINLTSGGYQLRFYNTTSTTPTVTINLTGTIASYGVHIVCQSSAASNFLALANQTNGSGWFSGDDAVGLFKNSGSDTLDIFGRITEDPGTRWQDGTVQTLDRTLVRKYTVKKGVNTNPSSGFPTLASEWTSYSTDEASFLGDHISTCENIPIIETGTVIPVSGYCPGTAVKIPFTTIGTFNSGNQFRAQLSNASGSFASPTQIGTLNLSGTDVSDTIFATMPAGFLAAGTNYRIRVVSTNPAGNYISNPVGITAPSSSPGDVTAVGSTSGSQQITLTWTNPSGCWDQVMIVATSAEGLTFGPTGNGSLYTANSTFSAFNQVVFEDTGTTATITGLPNDVPIYFEIYVRSGSNWSSGVEWAAIPSDYCIPHITGASCIPYISTVVLNTINNNSAANCGVRGYSSHTNLNTTLIRGESYTLQITAGRTTGETYRAFNSDNVRAWIDWDNDNTFETGEVLFPSVSANGSSAHATFTVPTSAVLDTLRLRIRMVSTTTVNPCLNVSQGETEDYSIIITDPCTSARITNFYPSNGTPGTEVRIVGTGLENVTAVRFNGVNAASFTIESDNVIIAVVPANSNTGKISITESGCQTSSSGNFTFSSSNACSGVYNDLIISEVYSNGNTNYIEVFNGTEYPINLDFPDNYAIRVNNMNGATNLQQAIDITGTIQVGQALVYYINTDGSSLATGSQNIAGFEIDAEDTVRLVKNHASTLDIFAAPIGTSNFSYRRLNTASAPAATFASGDWQNPTLSTAELGIFDPLVSPISITSSPSVSTGCELNMSTSATGSGLTYEWFYNQPNAAQSGWTSLVSSPPAGVTVTGANLANLQISGDMSGLDNANFYVVVSNGTCSRISNAAQFRIDNDPYFRSAATGNWKDASSWETAPAITGPWSAACTYPSATNSDTIIIQANHVITVQDLDSVSADQLFIDSLGHLILTLNSKLVLNNGAGADLVIKGKYEDQSSSSGFSGLEILSGSTWKLLDYAEIIKTNNSSAVKYRDNYEGGINNIPATANWRYVKITPTNPSVASASAVSNMAYPNLFFENQTLGLYDQNLTTALQGSGLIVIKGNLNIGISGNPLTARSQNSNVNLLQILGNLNIGSGSSLTNVDGAFLGSGFDIKGNINADGNFTSNAGGSGRLRLSGAGTQTISGIGTIGIDTLIIDKPAKTLVKLNRNIAISKLLQFAGGGIIQTDIYEVQVNNSSAPDAVIGFQNPNNTGVYDNDKYVQGKLRRRIAANGTYIFPVGDSIRFVPGDTIGEGYNPVRLVIRTVPGGTPTAMAEFIPVAQPDDIGKLNVYREFDCAGATKFLSYTGLTGQGYWKMDGNTFNNYDIYLHPNIANENNNPNEQSNLGYSNSYRALKEENIKAGADWDPNVSTAGDPCIVSNTYYDIVGAGYSGFSIFAPGGGAGLTTPLPVELISFTGTCSGDGATLYWSTASEFNSDQYILQGSMDGSDFTTIGYLPAAGFSNSLRNYSFTYDGSKGNFRYFRLAERDFDGAITYYNIVDIDCGQENTELQLFYSPGEGIIASMYHEKATPYVFQVMDVAGRLVFNSELKISGGLQRLNVTSGEHLAKGTYFVSAYFHDKVVTKKVVIW